MMELYRTTTTGPPGHPQSYSSAVSSTSSR